MGLWSYPIPEGGKSMTLIELSIKMVKTAPAKTCTFPTDWKKCCIFQGEKNRSPDEGFWACLGDLAPDIPRRPETWVLLCNLMLKLRGVLHSAAIFGPDSPQSNNS